MLHRTNKYSYNLAVGFNIPLIYKALKGSNDCDKRPTNFNGASNRLSILVLTNSVKIQFSNKTKDNGVNKK